MDIVTSLPPILTSSNHDRNTPNRKNLVPRQTSFGLGVGQANLTMALQASEGGVSVDDKLNEQFRYFRSEYVDAANTSGVAVPLTIVEDKSGHVFKFVLHGGPKYLFEVIQANLENIHLLRCALSLLVIIITLLRRKLPDPSTHKESSVFFPHPGSIATTDSIGAWVVDTLARIGDASAVSICINVLITSYNPSVQELALSLLASILMVSDEAVTQMLLPYTPTGTAVPVDSSNDTARRNNNSNKRGSVNVSPESAQQAEALANEQTAPKVDFKKLNFSYNTMDYSIKKVVHEKPKKGEKNSSCLSYVLSVILLQKNRHLLAAGCADIILAMLRKNKHEMSESIAMSCTCELPAIDDRKGKNENRSSLSKLSFNAQPEESSPHSSNPLSNVILEWAGLKLMLKFLFRYEKMSAQSKTATKAIVRESVSASLHLKEEYAYAHAKVFTAVCQLIANSPTVASYTNTLPGAEDLLNFTYHRFDPTDETHLHTLQACRDALNEDKDFQQRRRAQAAFMRDHPHEQVQPMPGDPRLEVYIRDPTYVRSSQHASQDPSRGTTRTPGSSISPSKNASLGHRHSLKNRKAVSQSLDAGRDGRLGTGPRTEVQNQSIELTRNFKVNFQSEYEVETEKRELYLLNSYDAKYGTNAQTDLKKLSKDADRLKAQTPLSYHPNEDMLLDSSLERIGSTALRPITVPRSTPLTEQQRRETEFLLGPSYVSGQPSSQQPSHELSAFHSTTSTPFKSSLLAPPLGPVGGGSIQSSNDSSSYPGRMMRPNDDNEMIFRSSQDFFGALRHKPVIPLRIEPKDVIQEGEPLHLIQKKFAKLAEEAKSRGETRTKAESERNSQQDLIKSVYGPKSFKYYDPKAPSPIYQDEDANNNYGYDNDGRPKSTGRSSAPPSRGKNDGSGKGKSTKITKSGKSSRGTSERHNRRQDSAPREGPPPIQEGDLFASFTDASGNALQDVPIHSAGQSSDNNRGGINVYGMEGMEFSVENISHSHQPLSHMNSTSTASDGPEVYGLRLENFDFDEANLFDGFKPIFSYAPKDNIDEKKNVLDPAALKEAGIGRKNKPDLEMAQTVDLILS